MSNRINRSADEARVIVFEARVCDSQSTAVDMNRATGRVRFVSGDVASIPGEVAVPEINSRIDHAHRPAVILRAVVRPGARLKINHG